ncbi:hypothetical protein J5N97_026448 [Dioscorea zingiberensis]|uniref:Glycosyltransferase n=1 Tax=Dioscorea zingiberensis TaxID=325984 RepID=A0A9D5H6S9_9LILI|nr:hypothetical protein J5N97_026448 [Dioscorea zingiberensis]
MAFSDDEPPHIALLPSAGMGHLTPLCQQAATLLGYGCKVSLIVFHPMVSSSESHFITTFLSSFPSIHSIHLNITPLNAPGDPFFLQFESIRRSPHLLLPLLNSSSPRITSLIVDMTLASTFLPVISSAGISTYIFFTSSAAMLSLCAYFPTHINARKISTCDMEIPGVGVIPKVSIPPLLHNPDHLFTTQFIENSLAFQQASGILINTFDDLEPEALMALNNGVVVPGFPRVIPVGPLKQLFLKETSALAWLDAQPERSVVYVSFGSRTAMSVEQIRELGVGLERSGFRFLWVIKTKKVDKEEEQVLELEEVLGEEFMESIKAKGSMVVRGWVEQEVILKHEAVGGFVSHCGWNSVMEAALYGVPVLAWPQHGDQKMNAGVVKRSGLGMWVEEWSWGGEEKLVKGEEIAKRVKELMESTTVQSSAPRVAVKAMNAIAERGSSRKGLTEFIAKLKV